MKTRLCMVLKEDGKLTQQAKEIFTMVKAWNIVKEKNVDIHCLKICESPEKYNEVKNSWEKTLNKKEFKLLKRALTYECSKKRR